MVLEPPDHATMKVDVRWWRGGFRGGTSVRDGQEGGPRKDLRNTGSLEGKRRQPRKGTPDGGSLVQNT